MEYDLRLALTLMEKKFEKEQLDFAYIYSLELPVFAKNK